MIHALNLSMDLMGASPAEFQIWCLSPYEHVRKAEVVGTNTGRQVGSPVPRVKSQSFILTHRVGYWKLVEEGRWGGIFYF